MTKTTNAANGTGSWKDWWWEHDWAAVRVGDVRKGDQLANQATVTKVFHGPGTTKWGGEEYTLEAGRSFIACGNGRPHGMAYSDISTETDLIVGRNGRLVRKPYRWAETAHDPNQPELFGAPS